MDLPDGAVGLSAVCDCDHVIISTVIPSFPLTRSRRVVVSYKRKYVHVVLVNGLFKHSQEKKCGKVN